MSIRGSTYILSNIKILYDHQDIKISFISTREVTIIVEVVMQSRYSYAQEHCVNWLLFMVIWNFRLTGLELITRVWSDLRLNLVLLNVSTGCPNLVLLIHCFASLLTNNKNSKTLVWVIIRTGRPYFWVIFRRAKPFDSPQGKTPQCHNITKRSNNWISDIIQWTDAQLQFTRTTEWT